MHDSAEARHETRYVRSQVGRFFGSTVAGSGLAGLQCRHMLLALVSAMLLAVAVVRAQSPTNAVSPNGIAFLRRFAIAYAPLAWAQDSLALLRAELHMRGDEGDWRRGPSPTTTAPHLPPHCADGGSGKTGAVLDTMAVWWSGASPAAMREHIEAIRQCVLAAADTLAAVGSPEARAAVREMATAMASADDPGQYLGRATFAPQVAMLERDAIVRGDAHRYDRTLAQALYDRTATDQGVLARVAIAEGDLGAAQVAARAAWTAEPDGETVQLLRRIDEAAGDTMAVIRDLMRIVVVVPATSPAAADARQRLATLRPGLDRSALEDALDSIYDGEFRPLRPVAGDPAAEAGRASKPSGHTVLLEISTAPDCGPCAAVDRALDGVLARYGPTEVIVLADHFWGPFAAAGDTQVFHSRIYTPGAFVGRGEYYNRVTHALRWPDADCVGDARLDGRCLFSPSPLREMYYAAPQVTYDYLIDRLEFWQPSTALYEPSARVRLAVTRGTNQVHAAVTVDSIAAGQGQPRPAHLAVRVYLVEDSLRYVGRNHVRVHRSTVRAFSGDAAHDFGFPIPPSGGTVPAVTFDLARVRRTLRATNEGYRRWENSQIASRGKEGREWLIPPYPNPVYTLHPAHLGVVAIVQDDATGRVLQSVYQPVVNRAQTASVRAM